MTPVDLKVLIPHADRRDIVFLLSLLQLDPKRRSTAEEAKESPYFREFPLPCPLSELPVPGRSCKISGSNSRLLNKDDDIKDFLNRLLV